MIARNLLRRRTRTALTLLGITIGITAIVTLSAMAEGLLTNFASVMAGSGADLTVAARQEAGAAIQVAVNAIDETWGDKLRAMPEVRGVAALLYTIVPASGVPYFVVFGHEPGGFAIQRFKVTEGQGLSGGSGRAQGRSLMLGKTAAKNLKKRVGDSLTIYSATYRIVGLYETGAVMEDGGAVVTLAEAQRLADQSRQVSMFLVQLKRPEQLEWARERIQRRLPDLQVVRSSDSTGLEGWLALVRPFAWATALIAALLGGVGMMNAMLMSVIERTQEIGVLRALGWKRRQVLTMILGESLTLSLLGGVAGTALGVLLVTLLGRLVLFSGLIQGVLKADSLLEALVATLVLGTVGGLYPAWRASRMTPVEALRYEGGDSARGFRPPGGMAARNLFRQRARSALAMLGVIVGVIAVAAITSLGEGFVVEFGKVLSSTELAASQAGTSDMSLSAIDERVGNIIESVAGVKYAAGGSLAFASLPEAPLFMVTGYSPNSPGLSRFRYRSGGLPQGPGQMALGWKAAQALGKGMGDGLRVLGGQFHVVGIYEAGAEFFDGGGIVTLRELQRLMGKPRKVMYYEIKLLDPKETDAVLARLRQAFPDLSITRSSEFMESSPDLQTTDAFAGAILALTLLVGTIVVMNTMVMSVFERTRELGVLRALGWRRRQVLGLIVKESLLLTLSSGLLGLLATWLLLRLMALLPGLDAIGRMLVLTPLIPLRVGLLCVGLGVLGGVYPAWRATRLLPVEALRYE